MLFQVHRKLFTRSDRVKAVDYHPSEPWLLAGLYNGSVSILHRDSGALIKSFDVSDLPVRCVKFIPRKNWFVAGSDDFQLRIFNYNTLEKVASFEAHPDYIRSLAVHPTASVVLTGSDDMTIKAWDWDKAWRNFQVYEGHSHYIMAIAFNPKDPNTFASASLDRTVKIWSLSSSSPNFTMDAHDKGVNYVDFYPAADKPYLVTCGDDKSVKVWDYHSKSCVQTMEGHTNNVSFAVFHPNLPIIISGSEDGTVKLWNSGTYRIENTLSYALERAWSIALRKDANEVAVGFDDGVVAIKLGRDEPTFSIDPSGKLVYTRSHDVLSFNFSTLPTDSVSDGTRIPISAKEIGSTELFPTSLIHSPNGRFVTVVGDGEYIIYTALAWRNKAFGNGSSFAWAPDSNTYAVLEGRTKLRLYKNFKEKTTSGMKGAGAWSMDGLYPGPLLAAKGTGFVVFWDWDSGHVVRRVDVDVKNVVWSGSATLVAIVTEDTYFIIRYDREAFNQKVEGGEDPGDEGIADAFEVEAEVNESVQTAKWVGDCFVYTTTNNRLAYFVGKDSYTISPFDTPLYLIGYIPTHNRVYLTDKDMHVYGYTLSLAVVEYQTAVLRGDMQAAEQLLPTVPKEQLNRVARFLEGRDLKELAIQITTDLDHKFELALSLDDLDTATSLARSVPAHEAEHKHKWKLVGDRALAVWRFELAKEAYEQASDLGALALLLWAVGDREGLKEVGERAERERDVAGGKKAEEKGKEENNLAFVVWWQMGEVGRCVDLLMRTGRVPEAAMLARTYAPSKVPEAVAAWKADLESKGRAKLARLIADPETTGEKELFEEGWDEAVGREQEQRAELAEAVETGTEA
ncbi:hypothetical protein APHAL10511_004225 [Amanita phalloides]|nr:hypothetical protein APHAL10511_004225 [Amanita phalloides]